MVAPKQECCCFNFTATIMELSNKFCKFFGSQTTLNTSNQIFLVLKIKDVRFLDSGADDCLGNPFGMMEMVSRVKAVLKRVQRTPIENVYKPDGISLSLKERLVKVDREPIQLSYKEFELLKVFMEHPGEVFTRQWLYERIWNGTYSEKNRTVDIHVQTLRKKLGTCGSLIESVKYIGYRMKKVP